MKRQTNLSSVSTIDAIVFRSSATSVDTSSDSLIIKRYSVERAVIHGNQGDTYHWTLLSSHFFDESLLVIDDYVGAEWIQ